MFKRLEEIRDTLYKYVEVRTELFKTESQEKIENIAIQLVYLVVITCLGFGVALFILILIASLLNNWLESRYLGFLIILLLFVLLLAFGLLKQNTLKNAIKKLFYEALKK
jgi:protein-S-isoprenylcysteine O-methyltransferase Ste14